MSNVIVSKTDVYRDGRIIQYVDSEHANIVSKSTRQLIDTQEAQTKAALIKLGWRPPDDYITEAERICIAIHDDFTAQEITRESRTIRDAWVFGEKLKRTLHEVKK